MNTVKNHHDIKTIEAEAAPVLANSTYELIRDAEAQYPDETALSFFLQTNQHKKPKCYSYRELVDNIHNTANFFHSLGANKDTVIAYILPNLPETHFVIWAGQATGIVAAINPLLEADAIGELLKAAKAEILVTLAPFPGSDLWQKTAQVIHQLPDLKHLALINLSDHVQGVKGLAAKALQKKEEFSSCGFGGVKSKIPTGLQLHNFNTTRRNFPTTHLVSQRKFNREDFSSYFCTGGTTGLPKIAMRRHKNEIANTWSASQFFGESVGPGKNIFCGLPLFHVNAVQVTGLAAFSKGAHVVLGTPQGYRGEGVINQFWEIVDHHKISFFSGVPTLYAALLDVPINDHNISSLEYGLCGAAPLPLEVFKTFQQRTGLKILEGYGLTEGTCVSSVNPPQGERRLGSIGLRIPGQKMKAVVLDDAGQYVRDCQPGETGALLIRGDNIFAGYRIDSQNKGLWVYCDDDEKWMNTGDLGYEDDDHYFWLTGRKKELIIRGGHNIDPATIEEPLHQHPAVQLVAAVGRPDPHAGGITSCLCAIKTRSGHRQAIIILFCS